MKFLTIFLGGSRHPNEKIYGIYAVSYPYPTGFERLALKACSFIGPPLSLSKGRSSPRPFAAL